MTGSLAVSATRTWKSQAEKKLQTGVIGRKGGLKPVKRHSIHTIESISDNRRIRRCFELPFRSILCVMKLATSQQVGRRMRELRRQRHLTQQDAARRCGLDYKAYQRYERQYPPDMRLSTVEKIATGFDVPVADLFRSDG